MSADIVVFVIGAVMLLSVIYALSVLLMDE
jgi:hypothetical protein